MNSNNKKRAHHNSAPISPNNSHINYGQFNQSTTSTVLCEDHPPAYHPVTTTQPFYYEQKATAMQSQQNISQIDQFYDPMPAPQTVIVHRQPTRSKDACCWGCLAAICLCFGAKECC